MEFMSLSMLEKVVPGNEYRIGTQFSFFNILSKNTMQWNVPCCKI